jgi:hypothetical protein
MTEAVTPTVSMAIAASIVVAFGAVAVISLREGKRRSPVATGSQHHWAGAVDGKGPSNLDFACSSWSWNGF